MIYWHIQMNQPWGRGNQKIDSILMLKQADPIIGTGEWDDFQCRNFKGEGAKALKEHDIILVREGANPIALCKVTGKYFSDKNLENKYHHNWYRSVEILSWYNEGQSFPQPQSTLQRLQDSNTDSWKFINAFYKKTIQNNKMTGIKNLIEYKKQIILQGPPGTGKTKLAKEIAKQMIENDRIFSDQDILNNININESVKSTGGKKSYQVLEVKEIERKIKIKRESETEDYTTFNDIINAYNSKLWESKLDQNNERRAASIAKFIHDKLEYKNESEQIKLIQFHPSYTYEDFVRGIITKPNPEGEGLVYETENKLFGEFANNAYQNYILTRPGFKTSKEQTKFNLNRFISSVIDNIDSSSESKYHLNENVYIFSVDNNRFKYKGDKWHTHPNGLNMNFSELEKIIDSGLRDRADIVKFDTLNSLTRSHATYYALVIDNYYSFLEKNQITIEEIQEKKFVLIIDEINRANLPSVLGELIYGLEYRGQKVESIYEIDGKNSLIIPPNLYIIATMNTSDRSVGHIDYAIRRRFAFVDVLPKDLSEEEPNFNSELFKLVKGLFTTDDYHTRSNHLSTEFEPKDVALGHSYFIDKTEEGGSMAIRLQYEIKPILLEYIKDGILKESARTVINDLGENVIHA